VAIEEALRRALLPAQAAEVQDASDGAEEGEARGHPGPAADDPRGGKNLARIRRIFDPGAPRRWEGLRRRRQPADESIERAARAFRAPEMANATDGGVERDEGSAGTDRRTDPDRERHGRCRSDRAPRASGEVSGRNANATSPRTPKVAPQVVTPAQPHRLQVQAPSAEPNAPPVKKLTM